MLFRLRYRWTRCLCPLAWARRRCHDGCSDRCTARNRMRPGFTRRRCQRAMQRWRGSRLPPASISSRRSSVRSGWLDLVQVSPGQEGKWFAKAKDIGFLTEAVAVARQSPCDPRTLTRASRDFPSRSRPSRWRWASTGSCRGVTMRSRVPIWSIGPRESMGNTLRTSSRSGRWSKA